jgi:hypothetical protein
MLRKTLFLILISLLLLPACLSAVAGSETNQDPNAPVSSDDPVQPVAPADWLPAPGDEALARSNVELETAEVLTLESWPPQYMLHLAGWKGNPCAQLRVEVADPDAQNRIEVEVYTVVDPAAVCIQVLESFKVNVPLGSLDGGAYSVWVNGQQVAEIVAP